MQSLAVRHGDLVVGPGGFVAVEGPAKVHQDLNLAILEPFGNDRFHPRWGSLLDRYVGMTQSEETDLLVRSEITRLVRNYMMVQQDAHQRAVNEGRRPKVAAGEMVQNISGIEVTQNLDRYRVVVTLLTAAGDTVALTSEVMA